MKKVKVIVKDKNVLELAENASVGDLIYLNELVEVDTSYIEEVIESKKDKVYASKLEDAKKVIELEKDNSIALLKQEIEKLKKENSDALKFKEKEIDNKYIKEISDLNNEIKSLKEKNNNDIYRTNKDNELKISKIKDEAKEKYNDIFNKFEKLSAQYNADIKNKELELKNEFNKKISDINVLHQEELNKKDVLLLKEKEKVKEEKNKEIEDLKESLTRQINEKEKENLELKRMKTSMNVKQTGEDLESWCDNEVSSYMQNGLLNCTWKKDNEVIKEEGEDKGSKADYIFKIYTTSEHNPEDELTSVCLDMKDENPDSVNKRTNESHYKQLDKNRNKKHCKYAVLVSNLELDKPNTLPMFKVKEYENMYVVRPAYLMVFLNMITSLTTRFSDLLLSDKEVRLDLKSKKELIDEFESIKNTYLDKPLDSLEKSLDAIEKSSNSIKKASDDIDKELASIRSSYIDKINNKISTFELKLNSKVVKKLD